uniref:Uncharacterized protein n=1 Tax=Setaria viridis TaxID=4556 RepID=A0A4U6VLF1_SETVI|nr:hypothetical protein SEVIR_3G422350v2 [Setaria viridis]
MTPPLAAAAGGAPVSLCTRSRNSRGSTRYTLGGGGGVAAEDPPRHGLAGGFCTALSAASWAAGRRSSACRSI